MEQNKGLLSDNRVREEIQNLKENGAKIVSLGRRILRTETAPVAISAIIMYELEM